MGNKWYTELEFLLDKKKLLDHTTNVYDTYDNAIRKSGFAKNIGLLNNCYSTTDETESSNHGNFRTCVINDGEILQQVVKEANIDIKDIKTAIENGNIPSKITDGSNIKSILKK